MFFPEHISPEYIVQYLAAELFRKNISLYVKTAAVNITQMLQLLQWMPWCELASGLQQFFLFTTRQLGYAQQT